MKTPTRNYRIVRTTLLVVLFIVAFGWSYRVTKIDFGRMLHDLPKAREIVTSFLSPAVFIHEQTTTTIEIMFPIPCGSAPGSTPASNGPRLVPSVNCAESKGKFTLEGFDLAPNANIAVRWAFPDDRVLTAVKTTTDADGHFMVPVDAKPIAASVNGVASRLQVDTSVPVGGLVPSPAINDVTHSMFETIFMALLSTTIATLVAAPLSFLAASNITRKGPFGTSIYYLVRSVFNITRSYDPLVMATVFGFWLGFGPLPGVMALTVVTIASLGKLFSEAVENIDTGPIEALTATGANRFQVIVYAVIPQIIPDYISFIIYHWDINVRISTIIGFVGGGGIGYYLNEQINSFKYHNAGTAVWAIVIIVWAMDFLSSEVRKRLT